ncbi:MAG: glycosyltransferase family 39 protein, partial [Candidatus Binatia bacterium]
GGFWPLAFKNGYNGPLLMYATALGLHVRWAVATPRVTAMLVGSLAVPLTYAAGRALGGRSAGAAAALLLVTSFVPVVVFGHVAWAITLGCGAMVAGWWAAAAAVRDDRPRRLIAAGFASGLAVQCHPVAAFALPGLAAWLLGQPAALRWRLLRAVPAATAAAALAYSPIVLYHIQQWRIDGTSALTTTRDLRAGGLLNAARYGAALRDLVLSLIDALSGAGHHPAWPWTADPVAWFVMAVVVGALAWCAVRGPRLPACLVASVLIVEPLVIREYNFPLSARYSGMFVPAAYLAVGAAAAAAWRALAGARPARRAVGRGVTAAVVVAVAGLGLARVLRFYDGEAARGKTNTAILALAAACADGPVALDDEIDAQYSASGSVSRVLEALLLLQRTPFEKLSTPAELDAYLGGRSAGLRHRVGRPPRRDDRRRAASLVCVPGAASPRGDDETGSGCTGGGRDRRPGRPPGPRPAPAPERPRERVQLALHAPALELPVRPGGDLGRKPSPSGRRASRGGGDQGAVRAVQALGQAQEHGQRANAAARARRQRQVLRPRLAREALAMEAGHGGDERDLVAVEPQQPGVADQVVRVLLVASCRRTPRCRAASPRAAGSRAAARPGRAGRRRGRSRTGRAPAEPRACGAPRRTGSGGRAAGRSARAP